VTAARLLGTLAIPMSPWLFQALAGPAASPAAHGTPVPSAFAGTPGPYTVSFTAPATGQLAAAATPAGAAPAPPNLASAPTGPDRASCAAALAYLAAHAAPGFVSTCPHDAGGHQATTVCIRIATCVPGTGQIWIADPCPAAYMNEASNSWVLMGESDAPWDPYGYCGQPGNPLG
jgi:hypothetical protein